MQDNAKYKVYRGLITVGRWVLFAVVAFIILFPVYWIFISSITPSGELFKTPIDYLPDHPTLESYLFLIENVGLLEKIGNTILIVGITLIVGTILCCMAAYGFARFTSKGVSLAFAFVIATMLIPEVVTARPLYEFMRTVGLYDTYIGLIILYISAVIPFTVLILKNFASEIPVSLEEAAAIDGANFIQRLFLIVLPLMRPAIATVCIINFITCLNNFFTPLYYSNNIQVLSVSIVQLPLRDNLPRSLAKELVFHKPMPQSTESRQKIPNCIHTAYFLRLPSRKTASCFPVPPHRLDDSESNHDFHTQSEGETV